MAGACASVVLGYLIWGVAVGPRRLRIERHAVRLPHLPDSWIGARIALLSDIHLGMLLGNENVASQAVEHLVRHRPAAILLAGDYVVHPSEDGAGRIAAMLNVLRPLCGAGMPVFAVLGNHDYQLPSDVPRCPPLEDQITRGLRGLGIIVLRNEAVTVPTPGRRPGGTPLYVVGIGEHRAGDDDVCGALAAVPAQAPRIVLMHNPETFPKLPAGAAPLAFAGHTHGSQVRLVPGTAPAWWLGMAGQAADLQHGSGWVAGDFGRPGNRLYITRGIGFSRVPVRINAPPELTYFTLLRARA